jgi:carbon-monoxide dehydrogenase large subunit
VDDLQLPGLRHLASVRSPHPHARVAGIDAGSAQAAPGVAAVLLATDLARSRPSR